MWVAGGHVKLRRPRIAIEAAIRWVQGPLAVLFGRRRPCYQDLDPTLLGSVT